MKYYSDGFLTSQYPNNKGGGFTVMNLKNELIIRENIIKLGITNNEVELLGCIYALTIAENGDTVSVDSKNTIAWITNPFKKKRARKDLDEFKNLGYKIINSKDIKLIWEPREVNMAGWYNEEFAK